MTHNAQPALFTTPPEASVQRSPSPEEPEIKEPDVAKNEPQPLSIAVAYVFACVTQ